MDPSSSSSTFAKANYEEKDLEKFTNNVEEFNKSIMGKMGIIAKDTKGDYFKSPEAHGIYKEMLQQIQDFEKDPINKWVLNHSLGLSEMGIELMVLNRNWENLVLPFLRLWKTVHAQREHYKSTKKNAIQMADHGFASMNIKLCRDEFG